jgi:YhcH/YjgK/YiaL family protein
MKKITNCCVLLVLFSSFTHVAAQNAAGSWSNHKSKKWFNKMEWLGGARLKPNASINKKEFARQYQLNRAGWDKAFAFIKEHDLDSLPKGKYPVDGDNVTASVTEDPSKDFDKTNWESHRKYIDIQCIISGEEKMGICPITNAIVTKAYDDKKDVANDSAEGKFYIAGKGEFFLFFPTDAHRPNITPGGNKVVKKIVIKVRVANP